MLHEGNPLEDVKTVTNRDKLEIITKDGKINKNAIQ